MLDALWPEYVPPILEGGSGELDYENCRHPHIRIYQPSTSSKKCKCVCVRHISGVFVFMIKKENSKMEDSLTHLH